MTSRALVLAAAALLDACSPFAASAQSVGNDSTAACQAAASAVTAYDQAAINSGGRTVQSDDKHEQRQIALARLMDWLGCGAIAGRTAAATILGSRALTDVATLEELVGPFRNFLDTAVVGAATTVAADAAASVPARIFALRTMWVLISGKYWVGYERMLATSASTLTSPESRCDDGLNITDAKPYWTVGIRPPAGFGVALIALAHRLSADTSQPLAVRSAATCVTRP